MTATSVALTVVTTEFLFAMCNCTVDSDVGILNGCGYANVRSCMSPGMHCHEGLGS